MSDRLKFLTRVPGQRSDEKAKTFIIVIPGIGTDRPNHWDIHPCESPDSWIHQISTTTGKPTEVWEFNHALEIKTLGSWTEILNKGSELLESITQLKRRQSLEHDRVPTAFICHSLGGIILKSALVMSKRQLNTNLLESLMGIIFLGTPHLKESDKDAWKNVIRILHACSKVVPTALSTIQSLQCVVTLCREFEDLTLPVHTLSVSERNATKLQSRFPPKDKTYESQSCVLVPKTLADTTTGVEVRLSVNANHLTVCKLATTLDGRDFALEFARNVFSNYDQQPPRLNHMRQKIRYDAYESPGSESEDDLQGNQLAPSLHDLTSHQDLARLQEPEQSAAAIIQHADGLNTTMTNLPNADISNVFDPRQSMPDMPLNVDQLPGPKLPCFIIDPDSRVRDFSGRQDILYKLMSTLVDVKDPDGASPKGLSTLALCGIGGIGKTSIASNFVYLCREQRHFDAIFWIRADVENKIRDAFSRIALELKLQDMNARNRKPGTKLVLEWLRNPVRLWDRSKSKQKAKWLIVYDNVDDIEVLRNFWPTSGCGSVLITSRDPMRPKFESEVLDITKPDSSLENHIQLEPFTLIESTKFLLRLIGNDDPTESENAESENAKSENAEKVARVLDCIPLALRQMADIMRYRDMTFHDFLDMYDDESTHKKLFDYQPTSQTAGYEKNLSTVYGLHLLEDDSRQLMNVLSLLDPDRIAEHILKTARKAETKDFPENDEAYTKARAGLWRSSLIARNKKKKNLKIHRVVQAIARAMMSPESWIDAFQVACALLLASWPANKRVWNYVKDTWNACDHILPHAYSLIEHYRRNPDIKDSLATVKFEHLIIYSGWYEHDRGNSEEAKPFFELAGKLCHGKDAGGYELRAEIHSSQGAIATETNDAQGCLLHYTKLLEITRLRFTQPLDEEGEIHTAIAYNELGIAKTMCGNNKEALHYFEQAKSLTLTHINSSDDKALRFYGLSSANLGLLHWMEGDQEVAKDVVGSALRLCERRATFDTNDSFIFGRLYHALGNIHESIRDHDEGLKWHHMALDHYRKTLGDDHHRWADVAVRLADSYRNSGNLEETAKYLDLAERIFNTKSCYKPEQARLLHRKALLLKAQKKPEDSANSMCEARVLYNGVRREQRQPQFLHPSFPTELDYDNLVAFWSR